MIQITKEFSRGSKIWVLIAVFGIYATVGGMVATIGTANSGTKGFQMGIVIGVSGCALLAISLMSAMVNDVRRSRVQLSATLICTQCGETLPNDFEEPDCPLCGAALPVMQAEPNHGDVLENFE